MSWRQKPDLTQLMLSFSWKTSFCSLSGSLVGSYIMLGLGVPCVACVKGPFVAHPYELLVSGRCARNARQLSMPDDLFRDERWRW